MRKLKITEGIIEVENVKTSNGDFYKVKSDSGTSICNITTRDWLKAKSNSQLIADAFNTANKCDMLPSELLVQRNESINLLKRIVIAVEQKHADKFGFGKTILGADTFLKKVFYNE